MKKLLVVLCAMTPLISFAQLNYPNYESIQSKINLTKKNPFVSLSSIGQSYAGEAIPLIKLEKDSSPRPTLLLVAGLDGKHPAGVVSSIEVIQSLLALKADSLNKLLANKSIWVVPMANPDAYKRNISSGVFASGNGRVIDNDRDGRLDEDAAKDLNGDGVLAQMRIKSSAGTHIMHPTFVDVLSPADRSKGEIGQYLLFNEGVDNDFDGRYGEDGQGGVNPDKNFTYDYPAFQSESGNYAGSEPESKALMEFIYTNPQISTILHFGLSNNLSEGERYNASKANQRIIGSWSENDVSVSKYISSIYKESVKELGEATKMEHTSGNFSNTAYYHMGRFSFSTPLWWPSISKESKSSKSSSSTDLFYQWVEENHVSGAVLPWTKINHPNFPNEEVEVGGVVEIYKNNPPLTYLKRPSELHAAFIQRLLNAMPELKFQKPVITALSGDIYRVELTVTNVGMMPTYPEIADKIKHVGKLKTVCELNSNQAFLSGKRLQLYSSLAAGKSQTFSWLIKGKGTIHIQAGCPTSGEINLDVKL